VNEMSMSGKGIQLLARYTNAVYDNERDGTNETAHTACKAHGEIEAYISALEAEIKRLKEALTHWLELPEVDE